MSEIREIVGLLDGAGRRFAIVASRFNGRIVQPLVDGAVDCLIRHGVRPGDLEIVRVPGAWEIPVALRAVAQRGRVNGLIALGVVIRGETSHFDWVCKGSIEGAARLALEHGLPVGLGVLTCETSEQAEARAGGKAGNKGWEAALATLEMADLLERLSGARRKAAR